MTNNETKDTRDQPAMDALTFFSLPRKGRWNYLSRVMAEAEVQGRDGADAWNDEANRLHEEMRRIAREARPEYFAKIDALLLSGDFSTAPKEAN